MRPESGAQPVSCLTQSRYGSTCSTLLRENSAGGTSAGVTGGVISDSAGWLGLCCHRQICEVGVRTGSEHPLFGFGPLSGRWQRPSPEKLDELLQKIPAIAYEVRSGLLQGVQQIAKQLPRKRGGGPKPRLATPAEKNQACAQIAALIGQGVKSREAIARVARSVRGGEGVSYRTMQRIWNGRPY
jgi:uncharacterized protein YoaH (UPF0181 family)